jgi:hypothetical protein
MARMSIDDMLGRDPRLLRLAKACGWSRRETAGCLVLDVWPLCYDREKIDISDVDIDIAADLDGFAQLMVNAGLATRSAPGKVRVAGARDRIRYLQSKRAAGYRGGVKSAEVREKEVKQNSSTRQALVKHSSSKGQARGNPSAPDLPSASASASASAPVPDPPSALVLIPDPAPDGAPGHRDVVAKFDTLYKQAAGGRSPSWGQKQGGQIKTLLSKHSAAEVIRRMEILFWAPPRFLVGSVPDLETLVQHFDKLVAPASQSVIGGNKSQLALDAQHERIKQLKAEEAEEDAS